MVFCCKLNKQISNQTKKFNTFLEIRLCFGEIFYKKDVNKKSKNKTIYRTLTLLLFSKLPT